MKEARLCICCKTNYLIDKDNVKYCKNCARFLTERVSLEYSKGYSTARRKYMFKTNNLFKHKEKTKRNEII